MIKIIYLYFNKMVSILPSDIFNEKLCKSYYNDYYNKTFKTYLMFKEYCIIVRCYYTLIYSNDLFSSDFLSNFPEFLK